MILNNKTNELSNTNKVNNRNMYHEDISDLKTFYNKEKTALVLNDVAIKQDLYYSTSKKPTEKSGYDSTNYLTLYFDDLSNLTLLSAQEEKELSSKIIEYKSKIIKLNEKLENLKKSKDSDNELVRDLAIKLSIYQANEIKFKQRFIKSNLRLVVTFAKRYTGNGMPLMDMIQEGNLGLIRAVDKFDYRKGVKFSTYAAWWIIQNITRALIEKSKLIKIPHYLIEKRAKIFDLRDRIIEETGIDPLPEDIANELDINKDGVKEILYSNSTVHSLDAPISAEDSATYADILEDKNTFSQDTVVDNIEKIKLLKQCMHKLEDRERNILALRFGLENKNVLTLDEIGQKYGLTRERIRQIEKSAITKIRKCAAEKDFFA